MHQRLLLFMLLSGIAETMLAQKTAYIPNYLLNPNDVNGAQFTWSKTAQSANFTLIWGNTVGANPANFTDPDLRFNPAAILDTMEYIYAAFKQLGFVDDAPGTKLAQFKVPVVIYNTWGVNGAMGWANGGDADGVIGAFWAHPNAMHDGGVAAHEFAHSMQAQSVIDYRSSHGLGSVWNNAGIFWETHANFMRNLLYPQAVSAWGMDVYHTETFGDWKNTYENYEILFAIMESEGIDMVNRLWRESFSTEYPLQTYKRLAGYNQAQFNDSLFLYARRMATFDFNYNNVGTYFRQYRNADLSNYLFSIQACYSILKKVPGSAQRYEIPIELAPEEFAYNVIPLYPETDSCAVIIKFKGHTEANAHAGWRYGFVAAHPNGTISRYSPTYSENTREINFRLQGDENKLYLVVMGAPSDQITTDPTNDTWQGYPKHFRFPYELNISGALPEGFQAPANFRAQLKTGGHLHSNGGGWVQNSATVAGTVYVAPTAMVLGNSNISGQVRLENTALVKNAVLSGSVKVLNNAFINGGTYSGSAVIQGQGFAENVTMSNSALIGMRAKVTNYKLSGTVEVGGDVVVYNETGNCNNGVYYRLTNYYDNKLLECDGRTATHPVNKDVNNTYTLFSNEAMAALCQCSFENSPILVDSMAIAPVTCADAAAGAVSFYISKSCGPFQYAWSKGAENGTSLSGLSSGDYNVSITDALGREIVVPVAIPSATALNGTLSAVPYNCTDAIGGMAMLQVSGGVLPIQYEWSAGMGGALNEDLSPGTYSVTATDAQGCTFSGSTQVTTIGQLQSSLMIGPISCNGAFDGLGLSMPLNGTAPYNWNWQGGETSDLVTNLGPGDYGFTLTDALGCTDEKQFSLSDPEALSIDLQGPAELCPMQQAQVIANISGGTMPYLLNWSNLQSDDTIQITGSGVYTVSVMDENGCMLSAELEVLPAASLELTAESTQPLCFGGTDGTASILAATGISPFQWLWATGQTDSQINNLSSGLYAATVIDALGCSNTVSLDIMEPFALALQSTSQPVHCFGASDGAISVIVSGGTSNYSFQWSNQATTESISGLPAGLFSLTVTDQHGCSAELPEVMVDTPTDLNLQVEYPAILCPEIEGLSTATATGGTPPYSYLWSTGVTGNTLSSKAGGFVVSVTDANDCLQTQSVEILASTEISANFSIQNASAPTAADGAIWAMDVAGGIKPYTYLWNNGETTAFLQNILPGTYTLNITDAAGCLWIFNQTVTSASAVQDLQGAYLQALIVPNPSASSARLWLDLQAAKQLKISIYDAYGRVLQAESDLFQSGKATIPLPDGMLPGLYWVRVMDEAGKGQVIRWVVI